MSDDPGPVLCIMCGAPALDAFDYDRAGFDGCCEDSEWGYCRKCDVWSERPVVLSQPPSSVPGDSTEGPPRRAFREG